MRYLVSKDAFRILLSLAMFIVNPGLNFCQPLKIGDTCPDFELRQIINYPDSQLKLSDFKGKLIILDFWNIHCRGCIASFRHIDSLQKRFSEQIQIVLVSSESGPTVTDFFIKRKKVYKPALPMVTGDTLLKKYLPHEGVPHHVWIDQDRKIIAITSGYNSTENSIKKYLESKSISLSEKLIFKRPDLSAPLFTNSSFGFANSILYYSYISPAIDSLSFVDARRKTSSSSRHNKIVMNKVSIFELFLAAFNEGQSKFLYNSKNVILEINDSSYYIRPSDKNLWDAWNQENLYLYELHVPPDKAADVYKIMQNDLEKVFNLKGTIETRKMDCMVLVRTSDKNALASTGKERKVYFKSVTSDSLQYFQNFSYESFLSMLKYRFRHAAFPIVDATDYKGNVDIAISTVTMDSPDYTALKKDLKKYDLDLVKMKWDIEVLVLKEVVPKKTE